MKTSFHYLYIHYQWNTHKRSPVCVVNFEHVSQRSPCWETYYVEPTTLKNAGYENTGEHFPPSHSAKLGKDSHILRS